MTELERAIIAAAEAHIGDPYVFGAWGGRCTPAYRQQYAGYNPSHASAIYKACPVLSDRAESCSGCKWDGALAFDCRGFTYWCIKKATGFALSGGGASSQYRTSSNWAEKGTLDSLPADSVVCIFRQGSDGKMIHTGLYIGGGEVIHCSVTVKREALSKGGWTHWARPASLGSVTLGAVDAAEETEPATGTDGSGEPWPDTSEVVVVRTLMRGNQGEDVRWLQRQLNDLGFDCGAADGKFGTKTEAAVKAFQTDAGLKADGLVGPKTRAAMAARLNELAEAARVGGDGTGDALSAAAAAPPPEGEAREKSYTVTLRGLTTAQVEAVMMDWPDCEVAEE